MPTQTMSNLLASPVWFGLSLILLLGLAGFFLYRWHLDAPLHALLGDFSRGATSAAFFLRGLFVPGDEFFSRAPADPRTPATGLTVLKWSRVPEVYATPDVRAMGELFHLLLASNPRLGFTLLTGEPNRQAWSEDAIALGPHYKAFQILDACEPRLVAVRQPAAFRNLISQELFEAKEGIDFGLIYKGRHPASHRTCWVVMGLTDLSTASAARFLHANARSLGYLVGSNPFAAVVSINPAKGWDQAVLKSLQPRPVWWRRLLYRGHWQTLTQAPTSQPA
jgi:hypothetical protein